MAPFPDHIAHLRPGDMTEGQCRVDAVDQVIPEKRNPAQPEKDHGRLCMQIDRGGAGVEQQRRGGVGHGVHHPDRAPYAQAGVERNRCGGINAYSNNGQSSRTIHDDTEALHTESAEAEIALSDDNELANHYATDRHMKYAMFVARPSAPPLVNALRAISSSSGIAKIQSQMHSYMHTNECLQ